MSGESPWFVGDAMAAVVHGVREVEAHVGRPPVIVGGLAVMSRLSVPYRATTDLDVVDRLRGASPHLEVLPTPFGPVKVDVLEVRQVELDDPSADPGDRLHAFSHAWANDTATPVTFRAVSTAGETVAAQALAAEPGPLVAMKLQAVMNRATAKQGTDLQDILRLTLDLVAGPRLLDQIGECEPRMAADIGRHVDLWLVQHRRRSTRWIQASGGADLSVDEVDLTAELLLDASSRS